MHPGGRTLWPACELGSEEDSIANLGCRNFGRKRRGREAEEAASFIGDSQGEHVH